MYFPVFADFRGRLYTLSNYLSYQSNDLARSLLLFDYDEILTNKGLECLNIYFANLGGFDKLSWNDRIKKSNNLSVNFQECFGFELPPLNSRLPQEGSVLSEQKEEVKVEINNEKLNALIKDLSEPFQFISIGLAKMQYLKSEVKGLKCIINNPVLFDASCSGIQHISALTLDKNLAKYTNVITDNCNPEKELPEDFYTYALNRIRDKLSKSDNEVLRNIGLNRKIIKRSVMTIPYNISMTGIGEQLEEHFSKIWELKQYVYIVPETATLNGEKAYLYSFEFGTLTKIIYEVLTKDIPSLNYLTSYFKNIIKLLNNLNLPIT